MNLMPVFLLEGCMCTLIKSFVRSGKNSIDEPVELNPLFKVLVKYADLFKNEHMGSQDESLAVFHKRINYFAEKGILEVSADKKTVRIVNKERSLTYIDFFNKLIMPLIDTYLITLTAIE